VREIERERQRRDVEDDEQRARKTGTTVLLCMADDLVAAA